LIYGHRVPKTHPRVEACGAVDELNSALGLARATATENFVRENLFWIQKSLVDVMGEIGVLTEDLPRYAKDGYALVTPEMTAKLDALVKEIESQNISFKGWATPGATHNSAALDVARTVCRRAERRVCALKESGGLPNAEIVIYLNRLSDLLWLLARWVETKAAQGNA
jgi:cob(I)alamin adenosyltransferase